MIDLPRMLTKFRPLDDRETDTAFFHTHVPWVAPEAYLHIVFKPAAASALSAVGEKMKIPSPVLQLLAQHNGMKLFSGCLSVYGVVRQGQLLNRSDPFGLPPFNIEDENNSWPPPDRSRWLKIGGYGYDGSGVCIDRDSLEIVVFRRGETRSLAGWENLGTWMASEITRLSELFDSSGRRLIDEAGTLPCAKGSSS